MLWSSHMSSLWRSTWLLETSKTSVLDLWVSMTLFQKVRHYSNIGNIFWSGVHETIEGPDRDQWRPWPVESVAVKVYATKWHERSMRPKWILRGLCDQMDFVWLINQMDGWLSQDISIYMRSKGQPTWRLWAIVKYALFEVQWVTNSEAMSQCICISGILCGQQTTNVAARSQW